MTDRRFRGDDFKQAGRSSAFDPIIVGAQLGLNADVSLEIWAHICQASQRPDGELDEELARDHFRALAKRVAARGGQLVPGPGRSTLLDAEAQGPSPMRRGFDEPVPGKVTEVQANEWRWGQRSHTPDTRTGDAERSAWPRMDASVPRPPPASVLAPQLSNRMSRLFGVDLSGVKMVPDSPLATGATRAMTKNGEVQFREGDYRPGTPDGDWLIAHELAHVVQQHGARERPSGSRRELEREADLAATHVKQGLAAPIRLRAQALTYYAFDEGETHDSVDPLVGGATTPSGGDPLPTGLRALFEQHFGVGLAGVRIHRDAAAAAFAASVFARALTIGEHIFFGAHQSDVNTREGFELMAHELTHVVQFYEGRVDSGMRLSVPDDPIEREAEAVGRKVATAAASTWFAKAATAASTEAAVPRQPSISNRGFPASEGLPSPPHVPVNTTRMLPVLRKAAPTTDKHLVRSKPLRPDTPNKTTSHDVEKRIQKIIQTFKTRIETTLREDLGDRPGLLERLAVQAEWDKIIAASDIGSLLLHKDYRMSRMFLYHYLTANGAPLVYTPPSAVCREISKRRPGPGHYENIDPYGWGNPDIRNGLGHFNLDVVDDDMGKRIYFIADRYRFPEKDDKGKDVRHGFQVGVLSKERAEALNKKLSLLGEYKRTGGDPERFEVVETEGNGEYTLFVPQRFLADHGVDFESMGIFAIAPNDSSDTR